MCCGLLTWLFLLPPDRLPEILSAGSLDARNIWGSPTTTFAPRDFCGKATKRWAKTWQVFDVFGNQLGYVFWRFRGFAGESNMVLGMNMLRGISSDMSPMNLCCSTHLLKCSALHLVQKQTYLVSPSSRCHCRTSFQQKLSTKLNPFRECQE